MSGWDEGSCVLGVPITNPLWGTTFSGTSMFLDGDIGQQDPRQWKLHEISG